MDSLRLILLILGVVLIAGIYLWETRWRRSRSSKEFDDLDTSYLDDLGDSRSRKDYEYARDPDSLNEGEFDCEPFDDPDFEDEEFDEEDSEGREEFENEEEFEEGDLDLALFAGEEAGLDGLEFIVPGSGINGNGSMTAAVSAGDQGLLIALTVMAPPRTPFAGVAITETMEELGCEFGQMRIFHKLSDPDALNPIALYSVANVLKPGTFDLSSIEEFSTPGITLFMQVSGRSGSVEAFDSMLEAGATIAERLGGELRDESRSTLTTQAINHLREQIVEFGRQLRLKSTE